MCGDDGHDIGVQHYGRILILAEPFFMLQNSFQSFLTTAGKQRYGLWISVTAGIVNMGLDFLLVAVFPFGIAGAAAATFTSQCVGGLIPFLYFLRKNSSTLRIAPTRFDWKSIGKACSNGSSEMLSNLSISLVSVLYNFQLMKAAAENGILSAVTVAEILTLFVTVGFLLRGRKQYGY